MDTPSSTLIRNSLIHSTRSARKRPRDAILIHVGIWLPTDLLRSLRTDWQRRQVVAIARTWAVLSTRKTCRATGLSAALILDLPLATPPARIHLTSSARRTSKPTRLPPVLLDGQVIAPETTTLFHSPLTWPVDFPANPIQDNIQALEAVILSCSCLHPNQEGFVAICSALRRLAVPGGARRRYHFQLEQATKRKLSQILAELPAHTPRRAQALWAVSNAEARCESVPEARLLWLLRSGGIKGVEVQHLVANRDYRFYLDFAIPQLKIALEFDGDGKYGWTQEDRAIAWGDQFERQEFLEDRGWTVMRVHWADLAEPEVLLSKVRQLIRQVKLHSRR
ncbi:endonuclease domain-containing protein [Schaalia vaccimaxillae]|uniref:endonuclease domain-containing protein n=1 Tax=Schaalia vaccimaxillae TaxID=183916 RepID=UPI0003B3D308|nr:base excision repair protein, HhH-GPD family [Schaalia vaccimaxillae]